MEKIVNPAAVASTQKVWAVLVVSGGLSVSCWANCVLGCVKVGGDEEGLKFVPDNLTYHAQVCA
jgi:hypothetical protein